MKIKVITKTLLIALVLSINSCTNKVFTNINEVNLSTKNTLKLILCESSLPPNQNYYVRKIVWNNIKNCGLIDISVQNVKGGSYYPFFVNKENNYIELIKFSASPNKSYITEEYLKFKQNHIDIFSLDELNIIEKRVSLGVIRLTSNITSNIFSGNTNEIDSLYLESLNNTIIYKKCR